MHSRERLYCIEVNIRLLQHYELILANSEFKEDEYAKFLKNFTRLIDDLAILIEKLTNSECSDLLVNEEYRGFLMRWMPDRIGLALT